MNNSFTDGLTDLLTDLEPLSAEVVSLSAVQIDQARQAGLAVTDPEQQWQVYLSQLAQLGFGDWLERRGLVAAYTIGGGSVGADLPHQGGAMPIAWVMVNGFKLCLIVAPSWLDERLDISSTALVLQPPDRAADFYVIVQIYEEQQQAMIHSFLRYDQLLGHNQTGELQRNADGDYAVPLAWFEAQPDRLLLYLRCLDPASLRQPIAQAASSTPTPISNPTVNPGSFLDPLTQPVLNTARWLQGELDQVAQQLSWVLLPAIAPTLATGMRSSPEEFEAILMELNRSGVPIPSGACAACRNINFDGFTLRMYAIVWPLLIIGENPEWTLLLVLGPMADTPLPRGLMLQVSDHNEVLVEQLLDGERSRGFLYAQVFGMWTEQFVAMLRLPNGASLTLPPFGFGM